MHLSVDNGCWPCLAKSIGNKSMTQKRPWIDMLVISVVGLMSSSPVAGTAVHFVPRWAIAGYLIVENGWVCPPWNLV